MEYYTFNTTWFLYSEIIQTIQNHITNNNVNNILEIGSYEGASACHFSDILLDNPNSSLTCVDPFCLDDVTTPLNNNTKQLFYNNISKSKNYSKVIIKELYSTEFYIQNDKKYTFIYIDGSHLLEDITIDFENCLKIIENNGIIWMDDYGNEPIKSHINNLYNQHKDHLEIIHIGYQIAFKLKIERY